VLHGLGQHLETLLACALREQPIHRRQDGSRMRFRKFTVPIGPARTTLPSHGRDGSLHRLGHLPTTTWLPARPPVVSKGNICVSGGGPHEQDRWLPQEQISTISKVPCRDRRQ
jgi:hypothetical protein